MESSRQQTRSKNGTYPLCREYLLAYTGDLSEAETDFLAYIKTAGQQIVEQFCVPAGKTNTFSSDQSSGIIRINGSSSAAPILESLAEDYQKYNKHVQILLETTDSTSGPKCCLRGLLRSGYDFPSAEGLRKRAFEHPGHRKRCYCGPGTGRESGAEFIRRADPQNLRKNL